MRASDQQAGRLVRATEAKDVAGADRTSHFELFTGLHVQHVAIAAARQPRDHFSRVLTLVGVLGAVQLDVDGGLMAEKRLFGAA